MSEIDEELRFAPREGDGETIGLVRLGVSLSNMYRRGAQLKRLVLLVVVISIIICTLGAFIGVKILITRPLMSLVLGTEIIGRGDLSHRVKIRTHDEIGQLANLFNKMAEDLSEKQGR